MGNLSQNRACSSLHTEVTHSDDFTCNLHLGQPAFNLFLYKQHMCVILAGQCL